MTDQLIIQQRGREVREKIDQLLGEGYLDHEAENLARFLMTPEGERIVAKHHLEEQRVAEETGGLPASNFSDPRRLGFRK